MMTTTSMRLISFILLSTTRRSLEASSNESEIKSFEISDEDRLFEELFVRRRYNNLTRPTKHGNETVSLQLALFLLQINVDQISEIFQTSLCLNMVWYDLRLTWNASDYGGIDRISVPRKKIWTPDIILYNNVEHWKDLPDSNAVIFEDGRCWWFPKDKFYSSCPIDVTFFPFDEQVCNMTFETWSYVRSQLNLTLFENDREIVSVESVIRNDSSQSTIIWNDFEDNSEWEIVRIIAESNIENTFYDYGRVKFSFQLRRLTLFYGFNLILPSNLISILTVTTYLLPIESAERIGLAMTTMLAMVVFQLMVADRVPPTSDCLPLIGVYFGCILVIMAFAITSMVIASNIYNKTSVVIPFWARHYICNRLSHLMRMRRPTGKELRVRKKRRTFTNEDINDVETKPTIDDADEDPVRKSSSSCSLELVKREGATTETKISEENKNKNEDEDVNWKYVALVIDRLSFIICIIALFLSSIVFYACAAFARYHSDF